MIRALYRTAEGHVTPELSLADIPAALADRDGLLWVDIAPETPDKSDAEALLRDTFKFHRRINYFFGIRIRVIYCFKL